ncbi:hypothetical protein [Methylopila sp. M107]|uniref:hypothetical protein n=1 Tax=Methylopila sp. M107 TaxID=1101190 RepID=UPI000379DBD0|nr:hypothetical protein [Methylopila sp. M107]
MRRSALIVCVSATVALSGCSALVKVELRNPTDGATKSCSHGYGPSFFGKSQRQLEAERWVSECAERYKRGGYVVTRSSL